MVEKFDTEEFDALGGTWPKAANDLPSSNTLPVLIKTWYHNRVFVDQANLETLFRKDYFHEPGLTEAQKASKTTLPDNTILNKVMVDRSSVSRRLTTSKFREACRALKGSMLQTEVYTFDGSTLQPYLYLVSEQTFLVRLLQPRGNGICQYSIFQSFIQENLALYYKRQIYTDSNQQAYIDPCVMYILNLKTDQYSNVLQTLSIAYSRRQSKPGYSTLFR